MVIVTGRFARKMPEASVAVTVRLSVAPTGGLATELGEMTSDPVGGTPRLAFGVEVVMGMASCREQHSEKSCTYGWLPVPGKLTLLATGAVAVLKAPMTGKLSNGVRILLGGLKSAPLTRVAPLPTPKMNPSSL